MSATSLRALDPLPGGRPGAGDLCDKLVFDNGHPLAAGQRAAPTPMGGSAQALPLRCPEGAEFRWPPRPPGLHWPGSVGRGTTAAATIVYESLGWVQLLGAWNPLKVVADCIIQWRVENTRRMRIQVQRERQAQAHYRSILQGMPDDMRAIYSARLLDSMVGSAAAIARDVRVGDVRVVATLNAVPAADLDKPLALTDGGASTLDEMPMYPQGVSRSAAPMNMSASQGASDAND